MPASVGPLAPSFSSPKRALLLRLKTDGERSLGDLARALGISRVAALRHLVALEGDGLVERTYRAHGVGRPRAHFRLTAGSQQLFPQAYSEVSRCALKFIEEKLGRDAVAQLLQRRAHEIEDANRGRFRSPDLVRRTTELARLRREGGYMAEMGTRRKGSVELLEHNCPILSLASEFPEACETERRMFESLLSARVEVAHRLVAGDPVCRFLVRPGARP